MQNLFIYLLAVLVVIGFNDYIDGQTTTEFAGMIGPSTSNLTIIPASLKVAPKHKSKWTVYDDAALSIFAPQSFSQSNLQSGTEVNGKFLNYLSDKSNDISTSTEIEVIDGTFFDGGSGNFFDDYLDCDISTLDMVRGRAHILNINPYTSPWQKIAHDMNQDGNISTLDLVQIRIIITRRADLQSWIDPEPWYYINDALVRPELSSFISNPFASTLQIGGHSYPDYLTLAQYSEDILQVDYQSHFNENWTWNHAVKMGHMNEWNISDVCNVEENYSCYEPLTGKAGSCPTDDLNGDFDLKAVSWNPVSLGTLDKDSLYYIDVELDSTLNCFSGFQQAFFLDDTQIEVLEVSSDLAGFDSLSWNVLTSEVRTSWVTEDTLLDETVTAGTKLLRFKIKALANVTNIPSEFYNADIDNYAPEYIGIDTCASDVHLKMRVTQIVGSSPFYYIGLDEISRDILLRGMDHRDIQEIRVYNQQGALIDQPVDFSPSGKNTWIRTGDWPTGLYYISVQMPEQVITQPITILR